MRAQMKCSFVVLALAGAVVTACGDDGGNDVVATNVEPDADGDGWPESLDCDDDDSSVFPAADDVSRDGVDQDCSGHDGLGLGGAGGAVSGSGGGGNDPDKWEDADGDGWPAFADCDDDDESTFPNADEVHYDGVDQDCSGSDLADLDGDGVLGGEAGDDCDDTDASVHAGSLEIALDGVDQDCDGSDLIGVDAFIEILPPDAVAGGVPVLVSGKTSSDEGVVLAAWPDSRNAPSQDIYARFLSEDGQPTGEAFSVRTGGLAKSKVRIAANDDSYLITWEQTDGIWAQQVSSDGELENAVLAIAPSQSHGTRVAWGGSNWALAWTTEEGEVRSRGVSTDGVRSDIYLVAAPGSQSEPALAGGNQKFLTAWADSQGIHGRALSATGEPVSEQLTLSNEPNVSAPELVFSGSDYFLAFRRGVGSLSMRGKFVSELFEVGDASSSARLSSDTLGISDAFVALTTKGVFVAWDDLRHQFSLPAYGGIYGNHISSSGALSWQSDAGLHVDSTADLGGLAALGAHLLVATRVGTTVGVVVRTLPE